MSAQPCGFSITEARRVFAIDENTTSRWAVKQADNVEQRTFARTRRPHQRKKLAVMQVEVDAMENFDLGRHANVVRSPNAFEVQDRCQSRCASHESLRPDLALPHEALALLLPTAR